MESKVVHIGKAKDVLSEAPKPPVYLNDKSKEHYKRMAKWLIKQGRLKETYLPALDIYAEAMDQFEFSVRRIKEKNREEVGTGYIQTFKSGASNVTTEVSLKNNAEATLLKCFKQFGLDPRSDKELKAVHNPNQLSLFEELKTSMQKTS